MYYYDPTVLTSTLKATFVRPKEEDPTALITFMNYKINPYTTLLKKMRDNQLNRMKDPSVATSLETRLSSLTLPSSTKNSDVDDLGGHATLLLTMVRRRSKEEQEKITEKTLNLPKDEDVETDDVSSEACVHGLSVRMTERSVSRSRVSRISTRRDMDIPSILAFSTNISAPVHLEIPAFQKINMPSQQAEIPRWSIRRSVCPVCSQKWKDRSSIDNVKYSGLKRNSTSDLPSVIAPARLRTSITSGYQPRPALAAVDKEAGVVYGGLRNTSAAWQLTRARRFRIPKLQKPPPEAIAPPSATAPLARKDLDLRVSRFLTADRVNLDL
ncbi:uncharacterized protein LOC113231514 [Hyposmocoma kahamanoa]|uniref:uncharacterized protein LOC113231514 n=1 Tax=Hyposmocoma kahamanoa TaxID=1477025 RepID=UPI000E6DA48D|nr:uncharacterized protein LOC113231514 [Hyposmocoma kahamanoa]